MRIRAFGIRMWWLAALLVPDPGRGRGASAERSEAEEKRQTSSTTVS
jgi:hypothetical protein